MDICYAKMCFVLPRGSGGGMHKGTWNETSVTLWKSDNLCLNCHTRIARIFVQLEFPLCHEFYVKFVRAIVCAKLCWCNKPLTE